MVAAQAVHLGLGLRLGSRLLHARLWLWSRLALWCRLRLRARLLYAGLRLRFRLRRRIGLKLLRIGLRLLRTRLLAAPLAFSLCLLSPRLWLRFWRSRDPGCSLRLRRPIDFELRLRLRLIDVGSRLRLHVSLRSSGVDRQPVRQTLSRLFRRSRHSWLGLPLGIGPRRHRRLRRSLVLTKLTDRLRQDRRLGKFCSDRRCLFGKVCLFGNGQRLMYPRTFPVFVALGETFGFLADG